jgi:hypothetical protein
LIVYIVHNSSITENGVLPVTDLFSSQKACETTLAKVKSELGADQKAFCAPVAPMKLENGGDVRITEEEWVRRRLREIQHPETAAE